MIIQELTLIMPRDCLNVSFEQSLEMLEKLLGKSEVQKAFQVDIDYPSPVCNHKNTKWAKTIKIVGINPRLTKTYWGIIKYAMTFPEKGIHLMPLFETGDKGSLYVQNSWNLNSEFMDKDLSKLGFDTPEKQLKLTLNLLHAMGKIVGIDVLPHVDNFSEIVMTNPKYFEWVKLNKTKTAQLFPPKIDYNTLYKEVEQIIIAHTEAPANLYDLTEEERIQIIFPKNADKLSRRIELMELIRDKGLEPIPVTEHNPCRPVVFDKIETDGQNSWAKFKVKSKAQMAKIIGCATPYKWYKIDKNGYPQKNAIEKDVWEYFTSKICNFQKEYNFDFIRCDMAHNQLSHAHNSSQKDLENSLEMWAKLKEKIQIDKPYFATLAEAFYNNYYINGFQDMLNKKFDIVLGDINYKFLNSEYVGCLDDYIVPFRENFDFSPCICIFSNDADLPENNKYYQSLQANEIRFFTGLFLNLPSYMGMSFEIRDCNPMSKNNFSGDYVKYQPEKYEFGHNQIFFNSVSKMRKVYTKIKTIIESKDLVWLSTDNDLSMAWTYLDENKKCSYLFAVNLNQEVEDIYIKNLKAEEGTELKLVYTNSEYDEIEEKLTIENDGFKIKNVFIGECAIYRFIT